MAQRLSAQDLRKKRKDLEDKLDALDTRIANRLLELVRAFPDAIIGYKADMDRTPLKAKSLESNGYIDDMSAKACLIYIERIEDWNAKQEPFTQGKLFNQ
jgi:hypothetical protein